jgi:hypothetical protein
LSDKVEVHAHVVVGLMVFFAKSHLTIGDSANGFFFCNFIYDQLLQRRPHFLFDLSRAVDFSFVKAAFKDFYVALGRDLWDPVLMFKMVFLQFFYDLLHRDIETLYICNPLFKPFLDLSAEELPPDHCALLLPAVTGS